MIDEKRMVKELQEFIQIPSPSRHEKRFAFVFLEVRYDNKNT